MPTSATGNKSHAPVDQCQGEIGSDAGFSLVELLCVLAIVSLMIGAVVLNLPEPRTDADKRTEAVTAQVTRFLEDGAVRAEMRALGVDADALGLFVHDGAGWAEAARLDWPDGARIVLRRSDTDVDLPDSATPTLLFEPYGAVPEFELRIQAPDAEYRLSPDDRGRIIRTVTR